MTELEPKPRFDNVFYKGLENMEKPEPPIDRVEAVIDILNRFAVDDDDARETDPNYCGMTAERYAREILKLLGKLGYRLVPELEALHYTEEQSQKDTGFTRMHSITYALGYRTGSQATIDSVNRQIEEAN